MHRKLRLLPFLLLLAVPSSAQAARCERDPDVPTVMIVKRIKHKSDCHSASKVVLALERMKVNRDGLDTTALFLPGTHWYTVRDDWRCKLTVKTKDAPDGHPVVRSFGHCEFRHVKSTRFKMKSQGYFA